MKFESLRGLRLTGFAKMLHKVFLVTTYPFRHNLKFLGFLVVGITLFAAIPMMQGVSYKHIIDWYTLRYDKVKSNNIIKKLHIPEPAERKLKNDYKKNFKFKETAAPDAQSVSDDVRMKMEGKNLNNEQVKRKTFKLSASPFKYATVKNTWTRKQDANQDNKNKKETRAHFKKNIQLNSYPTIYDKNKELVEMPEIRDELTYRKIPELALNYEEKPIHVEGKSIIFSANDLSVGKHYIILYGIYTNPNKYDEKVAYNYLKELADNKDIECEIVAYTHQNYATAICFIDGNNINKNMVDAGLADNIAL